MTTSDSAAALGQAGTHPREPQPSETAGIEYAATQALSPKEANKVALAALVGTVMEWYDFFLFSAAAALVFNVQYFTSESATAAALASFATFGVGLVARPVGGIIFGAIGDRVGRRSVLLVTIVGIGVVTGLIGVLPPYAAIGVAAPLLLVLLRIIQGLFVGGEWSGAMTIVVENAPLERRAMYAAIPQLGSPFGTILSSGGFFIMTVLLSQDSFESWGWRIPFLIAIPMLLIAIYIRSKLEESPVFKQLEEKNELVEQPVRTALKQNLAQIMVGTLVALLGVGGFYLVTAFVVWYGTSILGYSPALMLLGTMAAAVVEIGILLMGGRLGEMFGASRVVIVGSLVSAVVAVPGFLLLQSGSPVLVILSMIIMVATLSAPYAASGTVMTGLFPAQNRYTGVGMAQNTSGVIAGFVPFAATGVVGAAHGHWWPAAALLVVISLVTAAAGMIAPRMSVNLPNFKH